MTCALEEKDVWLRLVDFVMLPAQTLCDSQVSPFLFPEQFECALLRIKILSRDCFQHRFRQLDMPVLVVAVRVPNHLSAYVLSDRRSLLTLRSSLSSQ